MGWIRLCHIKPFNKQIVLELRDFDMIIKWVGLELSYVFEYP